MTERPLTNDELRTEVGKAFESLRWLRQYLDDDSPEAKAFDEVHHFAQGTDVLAAVPRSQDPKVRARSTQPQGDNHE